MIELYLSGDLSLAYLKEGQGPHRLVFIHGLCGRKEIWHKQIKHFKNDFEVIAVDWLGHGESSKVSGEQILERTAGGIFKLLVDSPKPTTVVGHSLGGNIVNELMKNGGCIENFVFVDSPCLSTDELVTLYQSYKNKIESSTDTHDFMKTWFSKFLTEKTVPHDRDLILGEALRLDPQRSGAIMGSVKKSVPYPISQRRVFVIEGSQYFKDDKSWSWLNFYPEAKHWLSPDQGHYYFLDNSTNFNKKLSDFLNETI